MGTRLFSIDLLISAWEIIRTSKYLDSFVSDVSFICCGFALVSQNQCVNILQVSLSYKLLFVKFFRSHFKNDAEILMYFICVNKGKLAIF